MNDESFSVLQWNIWYQEDVQSIVDFLLKNPTDIICLQELTIGYHQFVPDSVSYIANELGYNHSFREFNSGKVQWSQANGIFTRFPIINEFSYWINTPTGSGGYDDEYRAYLEAELKVNGKVLTIGTTHMSYTHRFVNTPRKERETDKLIEIIRGKKEAFIFTGDLNTTANSPTFHKVSSLLENVGPSMTESTWTTKPFSYNGFSENELSWRLDYIFSTKDMRVLSSEILMSEYSDHLPIRAEFTL